MFAKNKDIHDTSRVFFFLGAFNVTDLIVKSPYSERDLTFQIYTLYNTKNMKSLCPMPPGKRLASTCLELYVGVLR